MPVSVAFSLRGYRGPDSCVLFILREVLLLTQVLDEETKALWLNPEEPGLQPRQYQVEGELTGCLVRKEQPEVGVVEGCWLLVFSPSPFFYLEPAPRCV